jgi:hypothetical protein
LISFFCFEIDFLWCASDADQVTLIAGDTSMNYVDGPAAKARFQNAVAVLCSADGQRILVCDEGSDSLRLIEHGNVSTIARLPQPTCVIWDESASPAESALFVVSACNLVRITLPQSMHPSCFQFSGAFSEVAFTCQVPSTRFSKFWNRLSRIQSGCCQSCGQLWRSTLPLEVRSHLAHQLTSWLICMFCSA